MNEKSLKMINKLVYIVVSFVLLFLTSFMLVTNVESASAATIDDSLAENNLSSTIKNVETYTVNVYKKIKRKYIYEKSSEYDFCGYFNDNHPYWL